MKPDVLCAWPIHVDFPIWRQFIRDNRDKFARVIIVYTDMNTNLPDQRAFIIEAMKEDQITYTTLPPTQANEDWRDKAVNVGLSMSNAPWIWFTEQDFFPKEGFWEEIETSVKNNHEVFGAYIEGRLHPCCIFTKREVIEKTSKDFGVDPNGEYDHFGKFQQELFNLEPPLIEYTIDPKTYKHLNGLSQNMFLLMTGEMPNYQPEEFAGYLHACLKASVALSDDFIKLVEEYLGG